jgi:2-C-methyl-D-erythritol 2,4-cyclodiphosphate synthase
VVLHALCDALLGAAGLGDIGELFPDPDPRWKDADSRALLRDVLARVARSGFRVVNADIIVHAEQPKLAGWKANIRASIAGLLGVPADCVGVKATTNEGLGEIGLGEAIAAWAVVLLRPRAPEKEGAERG